MKKKIFLSVAIVVLAVMLVSVFVACTPSQDKVDKKFKDEGYIGKSVSVGEAAGAAGYTKILEGQVITIFWYENSDDAKAAYENFKNEDNVCKRGNAVAYGTEDAIDIFKKII